MHLRTFAAASLVVAMAPAVAFATVIMGGNDVIWRPNVDDGTAVILFDLNRPITSDGTISSFSIYAASGRETGQFKLKVFRDLGAIWHFVGESPLETVTHGGAVNTYALPAPISVKAGDILAWWYPWHTLPSIVYSGFGQTLNNGDWPSAPNVDITYDIPDLVLDRSWGGHGWDINPRTYSVEVFGDAATVPEPSAILVWSGLGAIGLVMAWRRRKRVA